MNEDADVYHVRSYGDLTKEQFELYLKTGRPYKDNECFSDIPVVSDAEAAMDEPFMPGTLLFVSLVVIVVVVAFLPMFFNTI